MGIRTGAEFRVSLRDDRTTLVGGEPLADVTEYPAWHLHAAPAGIGRLSHVRPEI